MSDKLVMYEEGKPGLDRRGFLKVLGVAGALTLGADRLVAGESATPDSDPFGVLVDTTRCLGCRMCEYVCAETNGLPEPEDEPLEGERPTSETRWTAVSRYDTAVGEVFVKRQCMHCLQPACASACLTRAMLKTEEGPVVWREEKCMGCRFCMISCPFRGPKFEYDSPVPRIQKCRMCWERLREGELPACVENCPGEALTFGRRSELIQEARRRIHENPQGYVHEIYGEHEAGGTSWLYLAAVPFEQLGFPTDLGTLPYPAYTKEFLYGVPVVLTLLPPLLLAISRSTRPAASEESEGVDHELDPGRRSESA